MRLRDLIIPLLLVSSLFAGLGGVGTQAIWVFPGVYYAHGNVNYSVSPVGGIDFSVVAVNSSYVQFNDIKFNITPLPSTDTVDVYINAICPDTSVTVSGNLIINFSTIGGTVGASYNLSGLKVSHTYRYKVDVGGYTSINSNTSGAIFFTYGTGVHDFLVYDFGVGTVPVVTTNASTGVEETNATLHGYLVDDGGEDCTVGFQYGTTTGYGSSVVVVSGCYYYNGYFVKAITSGSGDWFPNGLSKIDVLVVAGGGASGTDRATTIDGAGGGGAGGLIWITNVTKLGSTTISSGNSISYSVGAGGTSPVNINYRGGAGGDSTFGNLTAKGGGGGGSVGTAGNAVGGDGGSGGGGARTGIAAFYAGGTGTQPIQTGWSGLFGHGNNGVLPDATWYGGAGGGAGGAGFHTTGGIGIDMHSYFNTTYGNSGWFASGGGGNDVGLDAITNSGMGGRARGNNSASAGRVGASGIILIRFNLSCNISSLSPGTLYHYRAVANNSNGTGYGADMTFLTKPEAPTGLTVGTIHNTSIALSWVKGSGANNTMIRQSTTGYPTGVTDGDLVYNGTLSACTNTSLTAGTVYYYSAWSYTAWSGLYQWSDTSATVGELTRPSPPTNTNIDLSLSGSANLTWTKGTGANNTVILYKASGMPSSVTDGTVIYNGTGIYKVTPIVNGSVYYYKAWSYDAWGVFHHYSDNGTGFINTTGGGFIINCYDETTHVNLTFNVLITNGTFTYEKTGCINPESINASLCPHGEDVNIFISSSNHHSRSYIIDLFPGIIYVLNAYLPHNVSGGGDDASVLYNIQVVESYNTEYSHNDIPVSDVLVSIYRYINSTHQYTLVTSALTDANGFISVYLIPGTYLYVTCNKTGYNTSSSFWTPSPPNAFGQTDVKVFRIVRPGSGGVIPPIGPIETLFTGIVWSIMPHTYYYNDSFNVYFNISSSLGQINWYRGALYYHNTSNTPYTWDLLFLTNDSTITGGNIVFTVPDINGTYAFSCAFDKDNFSYYIFSARYYFVSGNPLESKVSGIPDMVWFVITIFIMIAAIAFLVKFGAGAMSGMGGLGVMAFMFALKPGMVIGNPPVSVWFIFIGTTITYLFVLWLSSRAR